MRIVLAVLLLVGLSSCQTKKGIDPSKHPIITRVSELAEYFNLNIDCSEQLEETSITKFFDGSKSIDYSYELLDSEEYLPLVYSITIDIERTIKDAKETYTIGKGALAIGGKISGQGAIEIDSLNLQGDDTYYALRTYGDEPNGHFYMLRKGRRVYTLIISGVYTSDHSLLTELILPKVEKLETVEL
ncbi:hypothetical protein [Labilibacter marinus]|uniref:hypothetical protein n=1 Tax=Labilibacter marinus TaxID=1477105 RepID=UPI000829BBA0|nr:hypothetical protein [Labilibacter marinus]